MVELDTTNGKVYVNPNNILAVSSSVWDNGSDIDVNVIVTYSQGVATIHVQSEEDAEELINNLREVLLDTDKHVTQEPTYLDGFKDGTEYVLKLMEKHNG